MAENAGEKSFDATPHRRQEAREQGQVAFSQDLGSAAMLMLGTFLLLMMGGTVVEFCARLMRQNLSDVSTLQASQETMINESVRVTLSLSAVLLPILGLMMLGGILVNVFQIGF